jgi:single-stranded DNA-binding protein
MVIGRVVASAYMGQDGKPKAPLEVTAESVRFLGGKNGNGVPGAAQGEAEIEID